MKEFPHAILIEGGDEGKRLDKAMELLAGFFEDDPLAAGKLKRGTFEDLIVLEPEEGKDITVDMVGELIGLFKQKPFASTGKACLIPCGERMNEHAQNKLLKLLEEPAPGDVILILTQNAEMLLSTVRSRCIRLWLGYPAPDRDLVTTDLKTLMLMLVYGKGSFAEAASILSKYEGSRGEAADFVRAFQLFLRHLSVGRFVPELLSEQVERGEWFGESASKIGEKHADRMRRGVFYAEKAIRDIERGDRIRYTMRAMALVMRADADNS